MAWAVGIDLPEGLAAPQHGAHSSPTEIPPSRARSRIRGNSISGSSPRVLDFRWDVQVHSLTSFGYFPGPRDATDRPTGPTGWWRGAGRLGPLSPGPPPSCRLQDTGIP